MGCDDSLVLANAGGNWGSRVFPSPISRLDSTDVKDQFRAINRAITTKQCLAFFAASIPYGGGIPHEYQSIAASRDCHSP